MASPSILIWFERAARIEASSVMPMKLSKLSRNEIIALGALAGGATLAFVLWRRRQEMQGGENEETAPASEAELPVIDLGRFLSRDEDPAAAQSECVKAAVAMRKYGALVVRDPRVNEEDNERFLDMMERYFELSDGVRDARPEVAYQVGVTPGGVEKPRDHSSRYDQFAEKDRPITASPPGPDPKWRFFWRVGPRPEQTKYPQLQAEKVIPIEFPEWEEVMDTWGRLMLRALHGVAGMVAEGFGLEPDAFQRRMENGPHLLAPTGSDFSKHAELNKALAGFHYDLNFLTIHGKSRFPGLFIWLRDGTRARAVVPKGGLLVQAGKQMEHLTGGNVQAGFHEVVVSEDTMNTIRHKERVGDSLWRVSSTCFGHIASDNVLEPLGPFRTPEALDKYPPIEAGAMVRDELRAIMLESG